MALEEQPREDLMREAVAYHRRALFQIALQKEPIFLGERRDGAWSIYFGEDPVFQFNARNQLRRSYFKNTRFAAQNGLLYRLEKPRNGGQVQLDWIEDTESNKSITNFILFEFNSILQQIESGHVNVLQSIPADKDSLTWFNFRLQAIVGGLWIAASPNA